MKTLSDHHVVCHQDDNGSFVAYVPAIAGCHAIGSTPETTRSELQYVFDMIVEEFAERGLRIPAVSAIG